MNDPTDEITISVDDDVLFRLREGRSPLVYPDTVARVSYDMGLNVIHVGTVWRLGYYNEIEALELEDGTVVALADVDPESIVVTPTEAVPEGRAAP